MNANRPLRRCPLPPIQSPVRGICCFPGQGLTPNPSGREFYGKPISTRGDPAAFDQGPHQVNNSFNWRFASTQVLEEGCYLSPLHRDFPNGDIAGANCA